MKEPRLLSTATPPVVELIADSVCELGVDPEHHFAKSSPHDGGRNSRRRKH